MQSALPGSANGEGRYINGLTIMLTSHINYYWIHKAFKIKAKYKYN